jgi:quercetin dioxygenase-like cupin family protein
MTRRSTSRRELSRRELLCAATASAAALSSAAVAATAAEAGKFTIQPYDQVQPQKFAWGWIRWLMNAQIDPQAEMTLGIVHVEPHQSNPLHVHPNSAEYLNVLSGACEHRVGDRWFALKTGDTVRIPRGVVHGARTHDQPMLAMVLYDTGKRQMVPVNETPAGGPK